VKVMFSVLKKNLSMFMHVIRDNITLCLIILHDFDVMELNLLLFT